MNKKIYWNSLRFVLPLCIIGLVIIFLMYNKPHKNFEESQPEFTIGSKDLIILYQNNPNNANNRYLDKILLLTGVVTDIEENLIILDNGIVCTLDPSQVITKNIRLGNTISIKGRCIGYDDLLEEIRIDHSFIMKNPQP